MIGLSGVRVIVVDDIEKEALPVLKAFSKVGIPVAFFDGQPETLPDHTLIGVRLAILDMDLLGAGDTGANKISTLTNYVGHLLSPNNGPYAVLAWTKHVELVEQWENYLLKIQDFPRPAAIATFSKGDFINGDNCDIASLSASLQETLARFSPLTVMQFWEEMSFQAAAQVTNALAEIAIPYKEIPVNPAATNSLPSVIDKPEAWRSEWRANLLGLMHTMAEAEAGKHLEQELSLEFFYRSLDPLHSDRMENMNISVNGSMQQSGFEIFSADGKRCKDDARAKINSMLHIAFDDVKNLEGSIYLIPRSIRPKSKFPRQLSAEMRRFKGLVVTGLTSYESKPEKRSQLVKNTTIFCRSVIIEISPSCDHAQKNIEIPHFLAGILVNSEMNKSLKCPAYIFQFGPIYLNLERLKGQYYLYFSARLLLSFSSGRIPGKALMRFRNQALTALRNWFSNHASRPGYLWLPPLK